MQTRLIRVIMTFLMSASLAYAGSPTSLTIDPEFLKPAGSRKFAIEYVGNVPEIPAGTKRLRVWIPVPADSTVQKITELTFSREARITMESKYGNKIAYWEIKEPASNVSMVMKFVCERKEVRLDLNALQTDASDPASSFKVFREADALVVIDDEIKSIAQKLVQGKKGSLQKARATYDYVLQKMTYDKNHEGWGLGSTRHACEVGKGNCTDFHALFNSLCRAEGIASGFEIGLYLPYGSDSQEKLGGYHCWALFRVPGKTWVPVDCSEGDRIPERKEFFFGGHTSNRVTLSTGRDITLEPPQAGAPLNYFLNPYAEADGKPVKADKSWSFKDF